MACKHAGGAPIASCRAASMTSSTRTSASFRYERLGTPTGACPSLLRSTALPWSYSQMLLVAQQPVWRAVCTLRSGAAQLLGAVLRAPGGPRCARTAREGAVPAPLPLACPHQARREQQMLQCSAWHTFAEDNCAQWLCSGSSSGFGGRTAPTRLCRGSSPRFRCTVSECSWTRYCCVCVVVSQFASAGRGCA